MVKKIFETEYDDGLHMADAKGVPGGKRGMLFDDDGLQEHAVFRELSDEELEERYGSRTVQQERELTPEEKEFYERLAELAFESIVLGVCIAAPYVKDAFQNVVIPKGKQLFSNVRAKFAKIGNKHKVKREPRSSSKDAPTKLSNTNAIPREAVLSAEQADRKESLVEAASVDEPKRTISRDEANERIARAMFLAQALADECDYLKHCCVEDTGDSIPNVGQLVGNDMLLDHSRLVLNGQERFLPKGTVIEFLHMLSSKDISSAMIELPLPEKPAEDDSDEDWPEAL